GAALAGDQLRRRPCRVEVAIDEQHLGPLAREHERCRPAGPDRLAGRLAGAYDDPDFSLEPLHRRATAVAIASTVPAAHFCQEKPRTRRRPAAAIRARSAWSASTSPSPSAIAATS